MQSHIYVDGNERRVWCKVRKKERESDYAARQKYNFACAFLQHWQKTRTITHTHKHDAHELNHANEKFTLHSILRRVRWFVCFSEASSLM